MKLVVFIPAFNEEKTIGKVIQEIPRQIEGIEEVRVLVINDGSADNTVSVASQAGADRIVSHKHNLGLARAFQTGLDEALKMGADIIVNTDADFQYNQQEISKIVQPVLKGRADMVLTDRRVLTLDHMPWKKKYGNLLATFITRMVSNFPVRDAQSGFRAFSREAALRLNVHSAYTYVQETIIQAQDKKFKIVQMPCQFRKRDGRSRLVKNVWVYAKRGSSILLRSWVRYKPLKLFLTIGTLVFCSGAFFGLRYLYFSYFGVAGFHFQSLLLGTVLIIIGFQVIIMALIADTVDANRHVNEEILYRLRKKEYDRKRG